MESEEYCQVELSMLSSLQHLIMTVKCRRIVEAGGILPIYNENTVGEWGEPRGLIIGAKHPKN